MMPNADDFEVQASRILALAIEAVENGKINTVDQLTALAGHYLDEAIAIERLCARSETPQRDARRQSDSAS